MATAVDKPSGSNVHGLAFGNDYHLRRRHHYCCYPVAVSRCQMYVTLYPLSETLYTGVGTRASVRRFVG